MTIDQIIALITSLATFVTSIIVIFTLFEMQKQRKSTFKPDIVLETPIPLHIYLKKHGDVYLPFLWSLKEIKKDDQKDPININIFNLGMGSAKSIEVIWDFDLDMMLNKLKNREGDDFINHYGSFLDICGIVSINLENAWKNSFDYILSSQIKHEPIKLSIPQLFLYLFSLIFYLEHIEEEKSVSDLPSLKMKLQYLDIANNIHKKEFELKIYLNYYSRTLLDLDEYESKYKRPFMIMSGGFEVKEYNDKN